MTPNALTVVTVTLNDRDGLEQTLASLSRQSERRVEHIIMDGGSADGSVEAAREHAAFDQTVIVSERDQGVYDAMNKGLAMATGELVTFLNAGDVYAHDDVLSSAIEDYRTERWQWAFGVARVTDSMGRGVRPLKAPRYNWWRHALGANNIIHQTVFYRTETLRELGGFDLSFPLAADYHATLRLGRHSAPRVWPRVDVIYLEGGLSDLRPHRALREMHQARCSVLGWHRAGAALSRAWFAALVGYVYGRRGLKRIAKAVAGQRAIDWWGRRGEPSQVDDAAGSPERRESPER